MKRADWNKIVNAWESAADKACFAAREAERLSERAEQAKREAGAAEARARCAESDLRQAVMAYGQASAQRALDGGTDEDRSEGAST